MVAEMVQAPAGPALLFEPDRPKEHGRAEHGWSRTETIRNRLRVAGLHRRHEDDERGAQIQHAIVRYVLGSASRATLADELAVSETQVQYYLRDDRWADAVVPRSGAMVGMIDPPARRPARPWRALLGVLALVCVAVGLRSRR